MNTDKKLEDFFFDLIPHFDKFFLHKERENELYMISKRTKTLGSLEKGIGWVEIKFLEFESTADLDFGYEKRSPHLVAVDQFEFKQKIQELFPDLVDDLPF